MNKKAPPGIIIGRLEFLFYKLSRVADSNDADSLFFEIYIGLYFK